MQQQKLNIALVLPAVGREGITKLVATQTSILQAAGHVVHLVVLSYLDKEVLDELEIKIPQKNVLLLHQKNTYLSVQNLLYSYSTLNPIKNFIKVNKIGVAIAHGPYAHFIMRLVKFCFSLPGPGMKLIQYFHINQYEQFPLNTVRRKTINFINIMLAKICDYAHVSVSEAVKNNIQKNLIIHRTHQVIYNPVSIKISSALLNSRKDQSLNEVVGKKRALNIYTLLLSNRIENSKGQLFFLKVVKKLVQTLHLSPDDFKMIIAGDGDQRDEFLLTVSQEGLSHYIKYVGVLSATELIKMHGYVDLVVVPSMFEGFSYTTLEALENGCLVLTSDAGGLKEVVIDGITGFTFKAGDVIDCFDKLNMLYHKRNETLIDQEFVKQDLRTRFSLENYIHQLSKIIDKI